MRDSGAAPAKMSYSLSAPECGDVRGKVFSLDHTMAAPATADDLVTLLEKSRLLESIDLNHYVRQRRDSVAAGEKATEFAAALVTDGLLTRFQADNLLQGKWMRFFIGPYKVLETLGAGGSGIVYLCEHERLRKRVAVKILQGAKARDPKSLERFNREARASATLDHPNIVRAFDVGQEDRFHYLVMEYVDGRSLRQIVKNDGPLAPTLAADCLRQAALGLKHAADAGLVHRDIKPSNLMVDRDGVVKILDLGLARFFEEDGDALTQGAVLGSADYIAPEQALDSHGVDIRADIYSLGATIWYCLTGNRPPRTAWEIIRRPSAVLPPAQLRSDVPEGMWRVLRKMMAPRPLDRYQTPSEVIEAIAPWAPDEAARLLLIEAPEPDEPVEQSPPQTTTETLPDHCIAPPTVESLPVALPAPTIAAKKQPSVGVIGRPWLWAGILASVAALGLVSAWLMPGRSVVPGRAPGARPYFKPVTPHSP
jgi:serine/threonine protein kinase